MVEKLRMIIEFMPIINGVMLVVNASPGRPRVHAALDVLDLLADMSDTSLDDEMIQHIDAVLRTPEGSNLIDWASERVQKLLESSNESV